MSRMRHVILSAIVAALVLAAPAGATTAGPGVQHLHYRMGPLHISPGQNTIDFAPSNLKPKVPGYITRFKPQIVRTDGTIPQVDVIHLHHGVWFLGGQVLSAVGEEKTIVSLPRFYGYRYTPDQKLIVNYMLHDLTSNPDTVYVEWDLDFVPDSSPVAKRMHPVHVQFLDVAGPSLY